MRRRWSAVSASLLLLMLVHPAGAACSRTCASQPGGCAKGFGTLAYVVTNCRVVGSKILAKQELRIHRSGCDPITVLRLENPDLVDDQLGLCGIVGRNHLGTASSIAGVFQRLGVTGDGKGVVFEISNASQLTGRTPLTPEQQGFFYVRADGTGLRRLGQASRDPAYRVYKTLSGEYGADAQTRIAFGADNRRMAFTDLGPDPNGVETLQLFTMELDTAERRQVTHLVAGAPRPAPGRKTIDDFNFDIPTRLIFVYQIGYDRQSKFIRLDGTNLHPEPLPPLSVGAANPVVRMVKRSGFIFSLLGVTFPGRPVNADLLPFASGPVEIFTNFNNHNLLQLTNFGYGDTNGVGMRKDAVMLLASADPFGENSLHNCQFFRISPFGLGLRQITHFDDGRPSEEGCQYGALPGCGILQVNEWRGVSDLASRFAFYSDCNPLGTNPNGSQLFSMRWNGSGLRQLTDTRGTTTAPDGSVLEVEIPGPVARGGTR